MRWVDMNGKRILIVTGMVAALGVPAGVAVAATADASPGNRGPASTAPARAGYGDPDECPYYNSTQAQQWRDQRADRQKLSATERQKLVEQHRAEMREPAASPSTP